MSLERLSHVFVLSCRRVFVLGIRSLFGSTRHYVCIESSISVEQRAGVGRLAHLVAPMAAAMPLGSMSDCDVPVSGAASSSDVKPPPLPAPASEPSPLSSMLLPQIYLRLAVDLPGTDRFRCMLLNEVTCERVELPIGKVGS